MDFGPDALHPRRPRKHILQFRYSQPSIVPLVLLLIAHPCEKFLKYTMPIEGWWFLFPAGVMRVLKWCWVGWWTGKGRVDHTVMDEGSSTEITSWKVVR